MKIISGLIFFSIFFGILFLGSYYVFSRGAKALDGTHYKSIFSWSFWIMSSLFVVGQFLERGNPYVVSKIITYTGSLWLVFLWFSLMCIVVFDLFRLLDYFVSFIPIAWKQSTLKGTHLFIFTSVFSLFWVVYGFFNALNPNIVSIPVHISKVAPVKNLKIVMVSDIHMGMIIGKYRIEKMTRLINSVKPDLIILAGDIVDHNPLPVVKGKMGEYFRCLKPPMGIVAVTGNHEYIGNPEVSLDYLSKFGINYLRDTTITLDGFLQIAGRDDKDKVQFTGIKRKPLTDVLLNKNDALPLILIDHQPVEYQNVQDAGVDLMVSGHTHNGQIWPFKYVTKWVYENPYGYMQKGLTHFYVSSGFGSWGPPVRIGSKSEIVVFDVSFD